MHGVGKGRALKSAPYESSSGRNRRRKRDNMNNLDEYL
jgi:hypothetical protein